MAVLQIRAWLGAGAPRDAPAQRTAHQLERLVELGEPVVFDLGLLEAHLGEARVRERCAYRVASSSSICSVAKSTSTSDRGAQWNARSQATNHAYSQLSGIETMSPASMWNHGRLRTRLCGRVGMPRVRRGAGAASGARRTRSTAFPTAAGQRLTHHGRRVVVERLGDDRGVERVGLGLAGAQDAIEPRAGGSAVGIPVPVVAVSRIRT